MAFSNRSGAAHFSRTERFDTDTQTNTHNRNRNGREQRGREKNRNRIRFPRQIKQPTNYQPLDVQTRQLTKQYFKLIQAIHHKEIIDSAIANKDPPRGMAKQVTKLTSFIKPASPSEEVQRAVERNTKQWLENNLLALQEHYFNVITNYTNLAFNENALRIAIAWAGKRYKARLSQSTVETIQNFFSREGESLDRSVYAESSPDGSLEGNSTSDFDIDSEGDFPPLQRPEREHHRSLYPKVIVEKQIRPTAAALDDRGRNSQGLDRVQPPPRDSQSTPYGEELTTDPHMNGPLEVTRNRTLSPIIPISTIKENNLAAPTQVHSGTCEADRSQKRSASPPLTLQPSRQGVVEERDQQHRDTENRPPFPTFDSDFTTDMGNRIETAGKLNKSEGNIRPNKHHPRFTKLTNVSLHQPTQVRSNVVVSQNDPDLQIHGLDQESDTHHHLLSHSTATAVKYRSQTEGSAAVMDTRIGERDTAKRVTGNNNMMMQGPVKGNNADCGTQTTSSDPKITLAAGSLNVSAATLHQKLNNSNQMTEREKDKYVHFPNTHKARKGRKIMDWQFKCNKPIWFLGDSNLHRMPPHCSGEIQVDSYPGASFYHFNQILEKTPPHALVKLVVLSVGINNRDQDPHKTSIKQLRMLYRKAQSVFPNANIYFPLINYSHLLPQEQKYNLDIVNDFALKRLPVISRIAEDQFQTVTDNIHWTQETAGQIFKHWCSELKLDF